MPHLILLGDSIFDNAAYTGGGPDVLSHVRGLLPAGWAASLLAVDGATTDTIRRQLERLPGDASHLVLSVGGNDALMQVPVLDLSVSSVAQALGFLADGVQDFEEAYRSAVAACLRPRLPLALCTVYDGWFQDPQQQRILSSALALFNDAILRVAIEHYLPVIDLRPICVTPEDYANPIEPSSVGGLKIARAIAKLVTGSNAHERATRIVGA